MPLERQQVPVTLVQGIDTKSDSKQQVPGSLIELENGRFTEPGKIRKRFGHDELGRGIIGGGTIASGAGLAAFRDELLASTGTKLYSYSEANDAWVENGDLFNVTLETENIIRNDRAQSAQDSCIHASGLQCFVWEDSSGGARYSLIDYKTKLQIVTDALIASDATKPKAFALGNNLVILYYDTSESDVNALVIPIASPTAPVIKDIATDAVNDVFDAQVIGSRLFVTYNNTSGNLATRYVNSFVTVSSAKLVTSSVAQAVAVFGASDLMARVVYYDGSKVRGVLYDYDLNPVLAAFDIETLGNVKNVTGAVETGGSSRVFYDVTNATPSNYYIKTTTVTTGGTVAAPTVFIRSLALGGKAFAHNGAAYVIGTFASDYQPTYFLLNNAAQVAAKFAPLSGGGIPTKAVLPQVNLVAAGVYSVAFLEKNTTTAVAGKIVSQTNVMQAVFDFTTLGLTTSDLGGDLHVGGGFLAMYDGSNLVEHGFHLFPESVSLVATTGGSIPNGVYQYVATYEWTDQAGNIHRSAPSLPTSITLSGTNGTVTVTAPTLRVTSKTNVVIHVYRTEAGGSVFYRVTSLTSPLYNDPTTNSLTYTDTAASSAIIGNSQLYTTGGIVENIAPPASEIFTSFKNRMILVPSDNKSQWWYSKEVVPGSPVEFSDVFVNNMDQYGGEIRAVGVLDDKIVFFKENTKFFVYGNGPAANGTGTDFSFPERITGDTGCVNQRSIVSTPFGLMYQSPKGIYLLDRSLQDQYIGAPLEGLIDGFLVTSAVLLADTNQVRFTVSNGKTYVFDYYVKQWSIDTGLNAADSALFKGDRYALIQAEGRVLVENKTKFTDGGRFVKMRLRTGWLNLAQVSGFQRVYKMLLLGEYKSPHRLVVTFAENFNNNPFQQVYIDAQTTTFRIYGDDPTYGDSSLYGGAFNDYQFRLFLSRQKSTSLQVTIEDAQDSGEYGEGFSISNLAFEVGVKRGLAKIRAGASYG